MAEMTNTLFRFITMRAPELVDPEAKDKYFIYHPSPTSEGFFHELLAEPEATAAEQRAAWKTKAGTFTPWATLDAVEAEIGSLNFDFSSYFIRNFKSTYEEPSGVEDFDDFESLEALDPEKLLAVWDNLFYQLATGESGPIRDRLIEIIMSDNFLVFYDPEDFDRDRVLSKVVIPAGLYGNVELSEGSTPATPEVYTRPLEKQLEVSLAEEKIERLNKLVKELEAAKEDYNRQVLKDYKEARANYDTAFAESGGIGKPGINEETGEITFLYSPDEPFTFTPGDEITETLISGLTSSSSQIAGQLGLGSIPTFDEALYVVQKEIERQQQVVFRETARGPRVVLLNNTIIPVTDPLILPEQRYAFVMRAIPLDATHYKLQAAINMGFEGADAVHAIYKATVSTSEIDGTAFVDRSSGNVLTVELFPNGLLIPGGVTTITVEGDIILSNGLKLHFDTSLTLATGTKGWMEASRVIVGEEEEEEVPEGPEAAPYIPSGFGIRRLGIADYRRVDQTTCCYVPGEVSHIENVMAREYKEKSSRRLRRSEETTTIERQTEKEDLTDTTSTDRYEMQQQTSEVLNKDTSFSVNASSHFGLKGFATIDVGTNFATNTSQQNSNSQALTYAKEVTERAQERVLQKVREERVLKIIDEYEEQNKHGFDNRKGNGHVSGVYRWVDKIYKNQLFNYGKRLMYEFMIPQPAAFHNAAMKTISDSPSVTVLEKPVDPRTRDLSDHRNVTEATAAAWAGVYNTEIESAPENSLRVSKAIHLSYGMPNLDKYQAFSDKIEIPEGYKALSATVNYSFYFHRNDLEFPHVMVIVGDKRTPLAMNSTHMMNTFNLYFDSPINKEVAIGLEVGDFFAIACTVTLNCVRTDQYWRQWQLNSFNAIIEAYEEKLSAYQESLAATQVTQTSQVANPSFYRQIENTVLRKNCIAYMIGEMNLGRGFYSGDSATDIAVTLDAQLDRYTSVAKFMEQAFEWDIMSYTFYPFYWGNRANWQMMYQADVSDQLFRSFLQSGMARVIVTVRPGFEEAAMYYMATGQIWNGGQVPVIGDDLYLSIVEELKNPTFYVEETWETRVPTTLTVIQSAGIGLNATGLPCCHVGEETGIVNSTAKMEGADSTEEEDPGSGE